MNMLSYLCLLLSLLLFQGQFHGKLAIAKERDDRREKWGYVEVRPKAHMFWWLYRSPHRANSASSPWPMILWLEGGAGGSGTGAGNLRGVGPLDMNLKPRNSTWLQKADLLFVDNPVGAGFSYVEDESLVVSSDEEAATDLTTLLKELFNKDKRLHTSPLFIVGESYGGRFAVTIAVSVLKAIQSRKLKLRLGGVALGDAWISPEDYVFSWGPLLRGLSRLDDNGLKESNSWGGQADIVYSALSNGFMKSRINEVDELLSNEVNVTIYNGQLDLICATRGTEAWVQKLKWNGLKNFTNLDRTPLYCNNDQHVTKGFRKSYKNLNFYWILGAGHDVPVDQPCIALQMIGEITHSPVPTFREKNNLKEHNFKM